MDLGEKIQRTSLSENQWLYSAVSFRNRPLKTLARRFAREDLQTHEKLNGSMWDGTYTQELADNLKVSVNMSESTSFISLLYHPLKQR